MKNGTNEIDRAYPLEFSVGEKNVSLRLMRPDDRDQILSFARNLPQNDLLFLRLDITQPEAVDEWIANLEAGRTTTLLAEVDGRMAGYASVHHNEALWTRHMGEIRVLVSSDFRQLGLGKRLVNEIFLVGKALGLKKLTVKMTPDQKGARTTFERLGFQLEALLADYVVDQEGKPRDMLIMSLDAAGFSDVEHLTAAASS
jgi:RimJ/RimL family protein N-acetyltransferase